MKMKKFKEKVLQQLLHQYEVNYCDHTYVMEIVLNHNDETFECYIYKYGYGTKYYQIGVCIEHIELDHFIAMCFDHAYEWCNDVDKELRILESREY